MASKAHFRYDRSLVCDTVNGAEKSNVACVERISCNEIRRLFQSCNVARQTLCAEDESLWLSYLYPLSRLWIRVSPGWNPAANIFQLWNKRMERYETNEWNFIKQIFGLGDVTLCFCSSPFGESRYYYMDYIVVSPDVYKTIALN